MHHIIHTETLLLQPLTDSVFVEFFELKMCRSWFLSFCLWHWDNPPSRPSTMRLSQTFSQKLRGCKATYEFFSVTVYSMPESF